MERILYSDPRESATHKIIVCLTRVSLVGGSTKTSYFFPCADRKGLREDTLTHIMSGGTLVDFLSGKAFRFRDMDWTELSVEVVEKARHN